MYMLSLCSTISCLQLGVGMDSLAISVSVLNCFSTTYAKNIHEHTIHTVRTYQHTCVDTHALTDRQTDAPTHTYMHSNIHTYIHTYIHKTYSTYIHTYIHTYIKHTVHTYINSYIHRDPIDFTPCPQRDINTILPETITKLFMRLAFVRFMQG